MLNFSKHYVNIVAVIRHLLSVILQVSAQASAPAPSCLIDSRAQMRVALRFLPQTSLSEAFLLISSLPLCLSFILLIMVLLHAQVGEHLRWKALRCRFGWKTARIFRRLEASLSTHLWNGRKQYTVCWDPKSEPWNNKTKINRLIFSCLIMLFQSNWFISNSFSI